jgi:hypothetical protein
MRNIFRGGPAHGAVHSTEDLLTDHSLAESLPFEEYTAGPSYFMEDQQEARDWTHQTLAPTPTPAPTQKAVTIMSDAPTTNPAYDEAEAEVDTTAFADPAVETEPTVADVSTDEIDHGVTGATDEEIAAAESAEPAGKPAKSERFIKRRNAKFGRKEVSEESGISVAVIARLETKGGTDEELATYDAAVDKLIAAQG